MLGLVGSEMVFLLMHTDLAGMSFHPRLDFGLTLITVGLAAAISLLGTIIPIAWLNRFKPAELLRNES
jgi:ABC-type lipoprotein release transport system permease subunit